MKFITTHCYFTFLMAYQEYNIRSRIWFFRSATGKTCEILMYDFCDIGISHFSYEYHLYEINIENLSSPQMRKMNANIFVLTYFTTGINRIKYFETWYIVKNCMWQFHLYTDLSCDLYIHIQAYIVRYII